MQPDQAHAPVQADSNRDEMALLQRHLGRTGTWKADVDEEFRRALLRRAVEYLAEGDVGVSPYEDSSTPVSADVELASLVDGLGLGSPRLPGIAEYLQLYRGSSILMSLNRFSTGRRKRSASSRLRASRT